MEKDKIVRYFEEGVNYVVPEGYEKVVDSNGSLSIEPIPQLKDGDFIYLCNEYYGILKGDYKGGKRIECYIYGRPSDDWLHGWNSNLCAEEIRLMTDEEKQAFLDLMSAYGLKPEKYGRGYMHTLTPLEPKYGVRFENREFVACPVEDACELNYFDTEDAAKIYARLLSRRLNNISIVR